MKADDKDDEISSSIISTTRYGHNSAKILRSIEKNFVIVIVIIAAMFAFSALDSAGLLKYLDLYTETAHDTVATIFSIISLAAMIPLLGYVIKSRRFLEKWQNLFERNSLKASLEISLTGTSREEIIRAVAESIEEIGEPLQEYLNAAEGTKGHLATLQTDRDAADFAILIDPDSVRESPALPAGDKLKVVLREFGSICVKVQSDDMISARTVESFIQSLSRYVSNTGNAVGLGLLIGQNVEHGAYRALGSVSVSTKKVHDILIIEKPTISNLH